MRAIDRWLGVPVCFALTALERLLRRRSDSPPRNALAILLPEAGSLALAHPAIRHLRSLFPGIRVRFLVFRRNRHFLERLGIVAPEDIWTLDDGSAWAFLRSSLGFFRRAWREGIDTTLDFDMFARASMILAYLSGARRRAGFDNYRAEGLYRGRLLTHPAPYNVYRPIALNYAALAQALALDPAEQPAVKQALRIDLSLPKEDFPAERIAAARERIREAYPALEPRTRIVALSPFSGNLLPIRAWPAEHYAEFLRGLFAAREDVVAVAIGLPEARGFCRPMFERAASPRLVDFIGRTKDIGEAIDLLGASDALVTSDGGPAHFASLTRTPTIVLFGPETPALYAPLGANVRCVYLGLHCSPCVSAFNHRDTPCKNNECMKQIKPEDVLRLTLQALE
ncbi:MAG: ADP-heptose--LPS heptosyltransferase 2 [candidate division BRC1 bacterium ADurb.BinA364]|nr:MAG: ADP-heptose--LPS heptosyltransferase 2 [candidate division BRC1 bacterium ADurb.BinA364]